MANSLEFILKLTDMFSPALKQATAIADSSAVKIASQFKKIEAVQENVGRSNFGNKMADQFIKPISKVKELNSEMEKTKSRSFGLGSFFAGLGISAIGKSTLGMAADREQQRISFGVMTGSQVAGDKMVNDIVSMGARTPSESGDLLKAAETMKLFGIENKNIMPNLQLLGDVAGSNKEKLQSLALAFSQVQSTGRLQGQDLLQLINAGFNPLKIISDKTGLSMAELKKRMEAGAISADMVTKAFQTATGPGGQFYKMMEKQSHTLAGRWSTFMDNAKEKLLRLGNALMPVASRLMDFGNAMMNGQPWAVALATGIGILTVAINYNRIAMWLSSAAASSVAFFTGAWTVANNILNASLWASPVTWIVAGIASLIAIIGYVVYATDGWGKQWDSVMKFLKYSLASFKDHFNLIWLTVQDGFLTGIDVIRKAWFELKSLWDKDGAAAGLASINNQQNMRVAEITRAKGLLRSDLQVAGAALKWEVHANGKGFGTMIGDIKKSVGLGGGVNPVTAIAASAEKSGSSTGGNDFNLTSVGKSRADSINSGGQRSIHITIGKQIEKLEVHVMNSKEGAQEIESAVREALRRVLYSMNGVVAN